MDDGSWLSWLVIVFLFCGAAYFAVTETAFASVSRIKLKTRLDRGDRRAERAIRVLDDFDRAISTILIGTNIVQIVTAALVTVLVKRTWGLSFVAVGTLCTTFAMFLVGEMLPKSIGKKHSERFALGTASSLCFFMLIFTPLSKLLTTLGSGAAKLTKGDGEVTVTKEELYDIIESMKEDGELDAEQGDLVHSALLFADVTAESVLTSRVDMDALDVADSPAEILDKIKSTRHSRLPVYRDSIDNIIGVLQIRKYIKAYLKDGASLSLEGLLDPAFFVHQSTKVDDLLPEMSRRKLNMAVVTDSYGGIVGLVTVEDILEEIVGEIWDEEDEVVESFSPQPDGSFLVSADMDVDDTFELMGFSDPQNKDWGDSFMGEWAYEQFELMPAEGDSFLYGRLKITIEEMRGNRIMTLRARVLPDDEPEGGAK